MLIEAAIQRLWKGQTIDMKKLVVELRDRRASMLQTEGQYVFAHLVILCYINVSFGYVFTVFIFLLFRQNSQNIAS